jgi:hypothetical protein
MTLLELHNGQVALKQDFAQGTLGSLLLIIIPPLLHIQLREPNLCQMVQQHEAIPVTGRGGL